MNGFTSHRTMTLTGSMRPALFVALALTFALPSGSANAIATTDARDNPALKELTIKFSIAPSDYPPPSRDSAVSRFDGPRWRDNLVPASHVTEQHLLNSPFAKSLRKFFFGHK